MRIALIGYGKMGRRIKAISEKKGHEISFIIRGNNLSEISLISKNNTDVAIDFSIPSAAYENKILLLTNNIPVVSGTTGWGEQLNDIVEFVKQNNKSFFYAPNFSYSLFMFNQVQTQLASLMNAFPNYAVEIEEVHHTEKKDSPSGTSIRLANSLIDHLDRKKSWINTKSADSEQLTIISKREPEVPGIHQIKYSSEMDEITLIHSAINRDVFVIGAIDAASFLMHKIGYLGMSDLITEKLNIAE